MEVCAFNPPKVKLLVGDLRAAQLFHNPSDGVRFRGSGSHVESIHRSLTGGGQAGAGVAGRADGESLQPHALGDGEGLGSGLVPGRSNARSDTKFG